MQIMGCDINPTCYSKLEGQVRIATDKEIYVIAQILSIAVDDLFEATEGNEGTEERIANSEGYINVDEYRAQANVLMKLAAELLMFVSYCGAQLNPRLYDPSPFLTDLLRKYDVEAKEARKKVDT